MEYSEIFLIAFILLAVFTGAQVKKFFDFLRGAPSTKQKNEVAPKTVLTMDDLIPESKKENVPLQSKVQSHMVAKKQSKTTVKKQKGKSSKNSVKTSKAHSKKKVAVRKK